MKIKLEKVISMARFVYFRDNGWVHVHTDQQTDRDEGTVGAYLLEIKTGRVWRCTDGRRIPVSQGNIEWVV